MKTSIWILLSLALHVVVAISLWLGPRDVVLSDPAEVLDLTLTAPLIGGGGASGKMAKTSAKPTAKTPIANTVQEAATGSQQQAMEATTAAGEGEASGTAEGLGSDEQTVGWSQVTRLPKVMKEVKATYPEEAKEARIDGPVNLEILIDRTGKVREVKMLSGPGYGLNESALAAVKSFEFQPALRGSEAVAVKIRYTYRFKLGVN